MLCPKPRSKFSAIWKTCWFHLIIFWNTLYNYLKLLKEKKSFTYLSPALYIFFPFIFHKYKLRTQNVLRNSNKKGNTTSRDLFRGISGDKTLFTLLFYEIKFRTNNTYNFSLLITISNLLIFYAFCHIFWRDKNCGSRNLIWKL